MLTLTATVVTIIANWGIALAPAVLVRFRSMILTVLGLVFTGFGLFGPARTRMVAMGVPGIICGIVGWFWGLEVLSSLGIVTSLPITPVTP